MPTMLEISQMDLPECIRADNAPGATQEEQKALRNRAFWLKVEVSRKRIRARIAAAKPGEDVSRLKERLAEYEVRFPTNQPTEEPPANGIG